MKNKIAIHLLLFTSIILLAHTIIPHHHHIGIDVNICDILSAQENAHENHVHNFSNYYSHCCEHETHDVVDDNCHLSQIYFQVHNEKHNESVLFVDFFSHHQISFISLLATLINDDQSIYYCDYLLFNKDVDSFFYSEYVLPSLGLRASPIS